MQIYYRSDNRSPETIFKSGFTSRSLIPRHYYKSVSKFALRNICSAIDINPYNVVSMTRKFESAPIFPSLNFGSVTYVYAILIPEQAVPSNLYSLRDNVAYDAHSIEVQSIVRETERDFGNKINWASKYSVLCVFEAFALNINPAYILCAIKCTRTSEPRENSPEDLVYANDDGLIHNFSDIKFRVHDEIYSNKSCANLRQFTEMQQIIVNKFSMCCGKTLFTTPVDVGLVGKSILAPKLRTFAEVELDKNTLTVDTNTSDQNRCKYKPRTEKDIKELLFNLRRSIKHSTLTPPIQLHERKTQTKLRIKRHNSI